MSKPSDCQQCGMLVEHPAEYHPYALCLMVKASSSKTAIPNLRAVIEYGMKAERAGVSVEEAMRDLKSVSP